MERNRITHVHSHFSSTVALLACRIFPITFSMTVHGPGEFVDVAGFNLAEKVAQTKFVAAISHYAASQVMRVSDPTDWHKIHVAPLGVDVDTFCPAKKLQPDQFFEITCVARLVPGKAHQVLLVAFHTLVNDGRPHLRLTLIGEGPERHKLERVIRRLGLSNHVRLVGACNQDQVITRYADTDIVVLPSFAEGVPVALMEAMGMELPCIATWITGVPELIRNGTDGLLVAPADSQALASALAMLIDDPQLRLRLGEAGRRRILEKYNLAVNIAAHAALFRQYLNVPAQEGSVDFLHATSSSLPGETGMNEVMPGVGESPSQHLVSR